MNPVCRAIRLRYEYSTLILEKTVSSHSRFITSLSIVYVNLRQREINYIFRRYVQYLESELSENLVSIQLHKAKNRSNNSCLICNIRYLKKLKQWKNALLEAFFRKKFPPLLGQILNKSKYTLPREQYETSESISLSCLSSLSFGTWNWC